MSALVNFKNWVVSIPTFLSEVKAEPKLQQIALVRIGRLSVMPLKKTEFDCLLKMGQTKL